MRHRMLWRVLVAGLAVGGLSQAATAASTRTLYEELVRQETQQQWRLVMTCRRFEQRTPLFYLFQQRRLAEFPKEHPFATVQWSELSFNGATLVGSPMSFASPTLDIAGPGQRRLHFTLPVSSVSDVAYSGSGDLVALSINARPIPGKVVTGIATQVDLALFNLQTGQLDVLVEGIGGFTPQAWSPDGQHLVYWDTARRTCVVDVRDRSVRVLMERVDLIPFPTWSPTGEWIAYRKALGQYALIRPDGSTSQELYTRTSRWDDLWLLLHAQPTDHFHGPAFWSPDGRYLALARSVGLEGMYAYVYVIDWKNREMIRAGWLGFDAQLQGWGILTGTTPDG